MPKFGQVACTQAELDDYNSWLAKKQKRKAQKRDNRLKENVHLVRNKAGYREYLKSPHWSRKRAEAVAYHGARCQECGGEGVLNVHHKHYRSLYREKMRDLEVLCRGCHMAKHPEKT